MKMNNYKPTKFEIELVKEWNEFTENYCITIPTIARSFSYMNSTKINMFLQGKSALSSHTIGRVEYEIKRIKETSKKLKS
jgi:hypothetical protein